MEATKKEGEEGEINFIFLLHVQRRVISPSTANDQN
jgi:hypothetical protein